MNRNTMGRPIHKDRRHGIRVFMSSPASPAISLVKPLGRQVKACPYCDHFSPADSKFCGACGAALHLVPCANCGAVNDITAVSACYRCHHELVDSTAPATVTLAGTEAQPSTSASAMQTMDAASAETAPVATRQRPHVAAVIIILVAFAAASYYAYRQRNALDGREGPSAVTPGAELKGNANAGSGAINKVAPALSPAVNKPAVSPPPPPVVTAPAGEKAANVPAGATKGAAMPPAVSIATPVNPAPLVVSTPRATRTRAARDAASASTVAVEPVTPRVASPGIQTEAPRIGPCTDAVAALGLCTRDSGQPSAPTPPTPKRP
ncbi:MAG: zinc ribbon domain-containing protein [Betaproteobacteria bacterium]